MEELNMWNTLPHQISWSFGYRVHHWPLVYMLLPFHRVCPMQYLWTKDEPDDNLMLIDVLKSNSKHEVKEDIVIYKNEL